jgi:hypothetical protein
VHGRVRLGLDLDAEPPCHRPRRPPKGTPTPPYVGFNEFRNGLPQGRFHVVVNPSLAQHFVARRVNALPVAMAVIGVGIALALAGHVVAGAVMVGLGIAFRRAVKHQAPKILLHLTSRDAAAYAEATAGGVMEVQRR